jgi:hypothetical protein
MIARQKNIVFWLLVIIAILIIMSGFGLVYILGQVGIGHG